MPTAMERLQAAAVDGRAHTVRYRQKELQCLHGTLVEHTSALVDAINAQSMQTTVESRLEVQLAIDCVRKHYVSLNLERSLRDEYAVAHNEDRKDAREPLGVVSIRPTQHTLLYSVIAPLAAALAAGNCVALCLERDLSTLNSLLQRILPEALDADTFGIVNAEPSREQVHPVLQEGVTADSEIGLASAQGLVVAVVDRTADLDAAARALVLARVAFGGTSPYAPDLVLVNEFVKKPFLEAVMRHTFRRQAEVVHVPKHSKAKPQLKGLESDSSVRVVSAGSNAAIVELLSRKSTVQKVSECTLQIHEVRSLDDAIDLANKQCNIFLASYCFASPSASKYLAQFIHSRSTWVNHIPADLLVGPAAPQAFPVNVELRYSVDMLQRSAPVFVHERPSSQLVKSVLSGEKNVDDVSSKTLPATGQSPGGAIGFFEQGLITGASVVLTPVALGVASGLYYGGRWAISRYARSR